MGKITKESFEEVKKNELLNKFYINFLKYSNYSLVSFLDDEEIYTNNTFNNKINTLKSVQNGDCIEKYTEKLKNMSRNQNESKYKTKKRKLSHGFNMSVNNLLENNNKDKQLEFKENSNNLNSKGEEVLITNNNNKEDKNLLEVNNNNINGKQSKDNKNKNLKKEETQCINNELGKLNLNSENRQLNENNEKLRRKSLSIMTNSELFHQLTDGKNVLLHSLYKHNNYRSDCLYLSEEIESHSIISDEFHSLGIFVSLDEKQVEEIRNLESCNLTTKEDDNQKNIISHSNKNTDNIQNRKSNNSEILNHENTNNTVNGTSNDLEEYMKKIKGLPKKIKFYFEEQKTFEVLIRKMILHDNRVLTEIMFNDVSYIKKSDEQDITKSCALLAQFSYISIWIKL